MLLAVDIGNSSIDFGIFDENGTLTMKSKMSAVKSKCADEYAVTLSGILRFHDVPVQNVNHSIISSVVPPLTRVIASAICGLFGIDPIEVGPGIKTGLNIKIDSQAQLGADIVSNAVGAMADHALPLVVVDIGTATTFTVIDRNGILDGVIIAPGVRVSLDALSRTAAELPDVSIGLPKRFVAKNTNDSMNVGVIYGHAFMIDGFLSRLQKELNADALCAVATGGLAQTILPYCSVPMEYIPDLTLKGLYGIHMKNKK